VSQQPCVIKQLGSINWETSVTDSIWHYNAAVAARAFKYPSSSVP